MRSIIDLVILGVLTEGPKSAYELTSFVAEKQVNRLLKISDPAIYKSCKRLVKEDYVVGRVVKKGNQAEKTVYRLNKKGKLRFLELMQHYSSSFQPLYIEFNAFIWNLERVAKSEGLKMLDALQKELEKIQSWLVDHMVQVSGSVTFSARMIMKQYSMMMITLLDWIDEVIFEYKQLHVSKENEFLLKGK
jgi:DNA-binding PadR family transcriptional regulator